MGSNPGQGASGGMGQYAYPQTAGDARSTGDLLRDIIANVQDLVRSEVRLAKAEFREETTKAARSAKLLAAGGLVMLYAAGFLLLALVRILSLWLAPWVSALAVGAILAIAGAFMLVAGRKQVQQIHPAPEKTIETVKENLEWMKNQTK